MNKILALVAMLAIAGCEQIKQATVPNPEQDLLAVLAIIL